MGKKRNFIQFTPKCIFIFFFLIIQGLPPPLFGIKLEPSAPVYEFEIKRNWITMKDGIRLSVTYFKPIAKKKDEKFPALFEFLPYRKDDLFYLRDYPLYTYFVRRGYVIVKVDIRGTGSSEGMIPPREYSEAELNDAVEIINQLSKAPWSNGNVGMWGISWSGFNAIQVAMHSPPGLKAIMASCASDDLFHDDVHYIDGAFHVDQYELRIDTKHGLPRWPDYILNKTYFEERFNTYPWFLTYLKQQRDSDFWRKNSLRWNYKSIQIPVYLLGGLLDGYRDSIPRMLENMKVSIKAEIGPYNHAWPDNAIPGPNYEWRHELVRWWDYWLKGRDTGVRDEPRFAVFVREGHPPDSRLKRTPGHWRYEEWPIKRTIWKKYYPTINQQLLATRGEPGLARLKYVPSYGVEVGYWWGETTGDMRPVDAGGLVFDSDVLTEKMEIIGFPQVRLKVSTDAKLAHWIARLEDVHPDGEISLITGALLNGSQSQSRLNPRYLIPGKEYRLVFPLHFTTWTFHPGHRIRMVISNSLFPMIWPTPYPMTTQIYFDHKDTILELPVIPFQKRPVPQFIPPQPREKRLDARSLKSRGWPYKHKIIRDIDQSLTSVVWEGESRMEIEGRVYCSVDKTFYQTNDKVPANSKFKGETIRTIKLKDRTLKLKTLISLHSDENNFYARFTRQIYKGKILVKERIWKETIPREFQ